MPKAAKAAAANHQEHVLLAGHHDDGREFDTASHPTSARIHYALSEGSVLAAPLAHYSKCARNCQLSEDLAGARAATRQNLRCRGKTTPQQSESSVAYLRNPCCRQFSFR